MARILLVDDMPMVRKTIGRLLRSEGHDVLDAADVQEAQSHLNEAVFDLALCDIWMPGGSGLDLMRRMKDIYPGVPVIIMSGGGPQAPLEYSLAVAETDGAAAVLVKPFEDEQLLRAVDNILAHRSSI